MDPGKSSLGSHQVGGPIGMHGTILCGHDTVILLVKMTVIKLLTGAELNCEASLANSIP